MLAWSLLGVFVVTSSAGVVLLALVPPEALQREGDSLLLSVAFVVVLAVFGVVGAIVASRLPANPVGWLFLGLALIEGWYELTYGYTHYSLAVASLPGTSLTAWVSNWLSPLSPVLIGLAFLYFPGGRLASPRWRPVKWLCILTLIPIFGHYGLSPGPIAEFPSLRNPFGVEGALFLRHLPVDPLIALILVSGMAAVVVRFRRAQGVERQQLKWFAWSAALLASLLVVVSISEALVVEPVDGVAGQIGGLVFAVFLCGLPVSAGLAILRYRLYDVDLVINRTLVYGALTATLALTYLGGVLLLQLSLRHWTSESDLAVAGSTLAVAALFRPARARIQAFVDHRFYRRRYDAGRTLEAFGHRLRAELDLDALGDDLRGVVRETMQPAHMALWLRAAR